jgi:chorismate-pyruvate lyase
MRRSGAFGIERSHFRRGAGDTGYVEDGNDMRTVIARRSAAGAALVLIGFSAFSLAHAAVAAEWPDTFVSRLEALALVQTLNGEILASGSATAILEKWCAEHRLAGTSEPRIVARLIRGEERPITLEQRQRLEAAPGEEIKVRHVQLLCGSRMLSEADNWYLPARLTSEMNRLLETTTVPFGRVVQDLKFHRRTFEARMLWWPLPEGWETKPSVNEARGASLSVPDSLFEHRAVLYTRDGKPFSEVDEVYKRALLDFPLP